MTRRRQALGRAGEERAERFLAGRGFRVLERGYRSAFGEIDLVAKDGETLVFIEVKTRSSDRFGSAESVGRRKQAHLIKTALAYLKERGIADVPLRFDVVAMEGESLRHIPDAFSAEGYTR